MNCDQARSSFPDYWSEALIAADDAAMEQHLAECAACRDEAARLGELWERLALLPAEAPSAAASANMRTRFYDSLSAYCEGAETAQASAGIFARWWPRRAVWQWALSFACLLAGIGLGMAWNQSREAGEVARLKAEVDSTRQLVVLSLLRQESASDRLRGVSWANQMAPADTEVVAALIESVNRDPNVNVRLAAVEALRSFSTNPMVRRAIAPGITDQTAPLVQVALIELAVDLKEHEATGLLREMAHSNVLDPGVQERARWALAKLQ